MKIIRNTPQHLIISDVPLLSALALSVMFIGFIDVSIDEWRSGNLWRGALFSFGVLYIAWFIHLFVRRVQLVFDASIGTLTVQRKNLLGHDQVIHELHEVSGAEIDNGSEGTRNVILTLIGQSAGRHPITEYYSTLGHHHDVADAINAWLDSHRARA
jgi:hypothetical protein